MTVKDECPGCGLPEKAACAWCQDYGDGMDPEPCPRHSEPPELVKPRWLPGEWPEMRDN